MFLGLIRLFIIDSVTFRSVKGAIQIQYKLFYGNYNFIAL